MYYVNDVEDDFNCYHYIARIKLDDHQVRSIFKRHPCQNSKWVILHEWNNSVFCIYNNRYVKGIKNTYCININTNKSEIINDFLDYLCQALECYDKYYSADINDISNRMQNEMNITN